MSEDGTSSHTSTIAVIIADVHMVTSNDVLTDVCENLSSTICVSDVSTRPRHVQIKSGLCVRDSITLALFRYKPAFIFTFIYQV